MAVIGQGTWLELGMTHIGTAEMYGRAEHSGAGSLALGEADLARIDAAFPRRLRRCGEAEGDAGGVRHRVLRFGSPARTRAWFQTRASAL